MSGVLAAALGYAARKWPVFPVQSGSKRPATPHGVKDASIDLNAINRWFATEQHSVAIATGIAAGIVVLDIDACKGGDLSVQQLAAEHGHFPETVEALTGGGGRHLFFALPNGSQVRNRVSLLPGIDVRGDGGYVVAPPSDHASGVAYAWRTGQGPGGIELAPCPLWLLAETSPEQGAGAASPVGMADDELIHAATAYVAAVDAAVEGSRNQTAFSLAGHLRSMRTARGGGLSEAAAVNVIGEWNARNVPPLSSVELTATVRSAWVGNGQARPIKVIADESWEEPLPLWGDSEPPTFPLDQAFQPALRVLADYFEALSTSLSVPIDMVVMAAIPIACVAMAKRVTYRIWEDYYENCAIWTLVLADSASRKSAVLRPLLMSLEDWEKAEAIRLKPLIAEAQEELSLLEERRKAARRSAVQAKGKEGEADQAEATELAKLIAEHEIPAAPELITTDPTSAALCQLLARNGERLLVASAESECIEHMMGKHTNGGQHDFQVYLKGHAGDAMRSHRTGRESDVMEQPALSVVLLVQPEAVRALFGSSSARGRGLLGRFLPCLPPSLIGHRPVRPKGVSPKLQEEWNRAVSALLALSGDSVPVELSDEAAQLLMNYQATIERQLVDGGPLSYRRDWSGKLVGAIARIALVLHGLEWAIGEDRGGLPNALNAPAMAAAIGWSGYLIEQEQLVSGVLERDEDVRNASEVVRWIVANDVQSFTVRDVMRGCRKGAMQKADTVRAAVQCMVERALVRKIQKTPSQKGGNKAERYAVNPRIGEVIQI